MNAFSGCRAVLVEIRRVSAQPRKLPVARANLRPLRRGVAQPKGGSPRIHSGEEVTNERMKLKLRQTRESEIGSRMLRVVLETGFKLPQTDFIPSAKTFNAPAGKISGEA